MRESLNIGEIVTFDVEDDERTGKLRAINVTGDGSGEPPDTSESFGGGRGRGNRRGGYGFRNNRGGGNNRFGFSRRDDDDFGGRSSYNSRGGSFGGRKNFGDRGGDRGDRRGGFGFGGGKSKRT
eukprot:UN04283